MNDFQAKLLAETIRSHISEHENDSDSPSQLERRAVAFAVLAEYAKILEAYARAYEGP